MPTRPCSSGCALEQQRERAEAAHDVLRRVGAVDAQRRAAPAGAAASSRSRSSTGVARRRARRTPAASTEIGVARHARVRPACRAPSPSRSRRAESVGARLEVPPPARGVEADDVVREQPVVDRLAQPRRQHVPVVALRPRDVDEVREQRVRPRGRARGPARGRGGSRGRRRPRPARGRAPRRPRPRTRDSPRA